MDRRTGSSNLLSLVIVNYYLGTIGLNKWSSRQMDRRLGEDTLLGLNLVANLWWTGSNRIADCNNDLVWLPRGNRIAVFDRYVNECEFSVLRRI